MLPMNDAALNVAVDRLEWALQRVVPRPESLEPVLRALDACQRALTAHIALGESPEGLFALADPSLLPFDTFHQCAVRLREEHTGLAAQLSRLRAAIQLDPVTAVPGHEGHPVSVGTPMPLHRLCDMGEKLCAAIRDHCALEHNLLIEPEVANVCTES